MSESTFTVDGRFTEEGISVSAYDQNMQVVDEAWFTWNEIEARKGNGSDFTFQLSSESGVVVNE